MPASPAHLARASLQQEHPPLLHNSSSTAALVPANKLTKHSVISTQATSSSALKATSSCPNGSVSPGNAGGEEAWQRAHPHMGDCQNYGPFLGPYYNTGPNLGDPKRGHNFDNSPHTAANTDRRGSSGRSSTCRKGHGESPTSMQKAPRSMNSTFQTVTSSR